MSIKDKIGTAAVVGQLVEELAELMAALAKEERRLRGESPTPCTEQECMAAIREEISDVLNCIGELQDAGYWYDPRIMAEKMKRWGDRVESQEAEKHSPVATNIVKSLFNWDTIRAYTGGNDVMEHTARMVNGMTAINNAVKAESGAVCAPNRAAKAEYSASEAAKETTGEGVKGMMLLRCKSCGSQFVTFLKNPKTEFICKCGDFISLGNLTRFQWDCSCGKVSYGRTNVEDAAIPAGALNCVCGKESPELVWNYSRRAYMEDGK